MIVVTCVREEVGKKIESYHKKYRKSILYNIYFTWTFKERNGKIIHPKNNFLSTDFLILKFVLRPVVKSLPTNS